MPPEQVLKGRLLMALYSVRSERQFGEQLASNLRFRWFLDTDLLEEAFDPSAFAHNRERLMAHDVASQCFGAVRDEGRDLMRREHVSVDWTRIEAWAARKRRRTARIMVGADRADDTRDFVAACREQGVTPHVAQNQTTRRRSALDDRTTRHVG